MYTHTQYARCSRFLREISMFIMENCHMTTWLTCGWLHHSHHSTWVHPPITNIFTLQLRITSGKALRRGKNRVHFLRCDVRLRFFYSFLFSNHYMRVIHYHIIDSVNNNIGESQDERIQYWYEMSIVFVIIQVGWLTG